MCSRRRGSEDENSETLYSPSERFLITPNTFGDIWRAYNEVLQKESIPKYLGKKRLQSSLGILGMRLVTAATILDLADDKGGASRRRHFLPEEKSLVSGNVFVGRQIIKADFEMVGAVAYMPIGVAAYPVESFSFRVILPFLEFDLNVDVLDDNYHLFFPTRYEILELQRAFGSQSPEYILGVYSNITAERTERWREVLYFFWMQQQQVLKERGIRGGILGRIRRCKKKQEECEEMQWFKEQLFAAKGSLERLALSDLLYNARKDPFIDGKTPPGPIAI